MHASIQYYAAPNKLQHESTTGTRCAVFPVMLSTKDSNITTVFFNPSCLCHFFRPELLCGMFSETIVKCKLFYYY